MGDPVAGYHRCVSPAPTVAGPHVPALRSAFVCARTVEVNLVWSVRHLLEVLVDLTSANKLALTEPLFVENARALIEEANGVLDRIDPH